MVVLNATTARRELDRREWDECRLASEMGVSYQTVRNLFDGKHNVSQRTQVALFNAFGGHVAFSDLFQVVPGPEATSAPATDNAAAASAAEVKA